MLWGALVLIVLAVLAFKILAGTIRFFLGGFGIVIAIGLLIYWNQSDRKVTTVPVTETARPVSE